MRAHPAFFWIKKPLSLDCKRTNNSATFFFLGGGEHGNGQVQKFGKKTSLSLMRSNLSFRMGKIDSFFSVGGLDVIRSRCSWLSWLIWRIKFAGFLLLFLDLHLRCCWEKNYYAVWYTFGTEKRPFKATNFESWLIVVFYSPSTICPLFVVLLRFDISKHPVLNVENV